MIVVRFREGRDDKLKEWYEGLPKGDRSRVVRDILKRHVKENSMGRKNNLQHEEIKQNNVDIESKVDRLMDRF